MAFLDTTGLSHLWDSLKATFRRTNGYGIRWNQYSFSDAIQGQAGECRICRHDPSTDAWSDAAGWVWWNGVKRTVPAGTLNLNSVALQRTVYIVLRLSSASSTTGTLYAVWFQSGWKYLTAGTDSASSSTTAAWTWAETTDIVIGSCVMPDADTSNMTHVNTYDPPLNAREVSRGDTTAGIGTIEYITGTQTTATGSWTGVSKSEKLYVGKTIAYRLPYAGSGNASLNLTMADGTTTGAKAVYYGTTRVTTHYAAGSIIYLTYNGTDWRRCDYNSDTINRLKYDRVVTASGDITSGHLVCADQNGGYRDMAAGIAHDMRYPIMYASTTVAEGADSGTRNNNYIAINNMNYSNNGTITGGANDKMLWLRGTMSNDTFTVAASPFMTTVEPTTEDGFTYLRLGQMVSATNGYFEFAREAWAFYNGKFQMVGAEPRVDGTTIALDQDGRLTLNLPSLDDTSY